MGKKQLSKKQLGFAVIAAATIVLALIIWRVGVPLVRFASEPEKFRLWVESSGVWSRFAYAGMMIFQIIIAFLPGEPFEIAAGYAFGAVEGTILCLAASTLGSMLVFLLVRRYGMRLVELFFSADKLKSIRFLKTTPRRGFIFFIIFMIPGTPKDLLCYFAGLTDMKLLTWLAICSLGRLPAIITSTVGGDALGTSDYRFAIIVFAVTLGISLIGIAVYKLICKMHDK